jgi:hypothetical protein
VSRSQSRQRASSALLRAERSGGAGVCVQRRHEELDCLLRASRRYRTGQGKSGGACSILLEGCRTFRTAAVDLEGIPLAIAPLVVGGIKAGQRAIRSLGVRTQGAGIFGPKTRAGNRIRLPVSGVRRECRGSVRGALPTVRTARAVWSFDLRMHSRWSQLYLLSRKHTSFILPCATNRKPRKYHSPRERLLECRQPY